MKKQTLAPAPPPPPALRNSIALCVLLGLLLVLALRMTMTETLRQTLTQKAAAIAAQGSDHADDMPPFDGPTITIGLAALTTALAAAAAFCAAKSRPPVPTRLGRFTLIFAIVAVTFLAAFHAVNRFDALVGAADVASSLLAGWAVGLLCDSRLLADTGRRIVIAAIIALLAAWTAKGLFQRFVEFPDTFAYYEKDKPRLLEQNGIRPTDQYQVAAFESRLKSMEVFGFLSLSNVMATGMIGLLATLAGLLAACAIARAIPHPAENHSAKRHTPKSSASPPPRPLLEILAAAVFLLPLGGLLVLAGMLTAIFTGSRGGAFFSIACPIAIGIGALAWKKIVACRNRILIAAAIIAVLAAAAVISYGLRFDTLPSKSLMFRWHYWTAAAKLIERAPLAGVGLNNFGDYYAEVKRPTSPEDVSDPHSFFVRIAAEMGIPAAILIAVWIVWQIISATRRPTPNDSAIPPPPSARPLISALLAYTTLWWLLHYFLADAQNSYNVVIDCLFAIIAACAACAAFALANRLSSSGIRAACSAALVGAVGMLAYDQINMALVTGPIAMLFWMLLGLADSYAPPPSPLSPTLRQPSHAVRLLPAALAAAFAVALAAAVWIPLLNDAMPWDPAPFEYQYLAAMAPAKPDLNAALASLDAAVDRSPRSLELLDQRIYTRRLMHLPVAADIHRVLDLDRANARPRILVATPASDLSPAERVKILREALWLDHWFPPDEIKRLAPDERLRVEALIRELSGEAGSRP